MPEPITLKCMEFCGGGLPECEGKCPYPPIVFSEPEPCPKCGQVPNGQHGEYPCELCGLPTMWDEEAPKETEPARDNTERAEYDAQISDLRYGGCN